MTADQYLQGTKDRLETDGYRFYLPPYDTTDQVELAAWNKATFFPYVLDLVVAFARFGGLDESALREFVAAGAELALTKRPIRKRPLGLLAVALADDPDDGAVLDAEWGDAPRYPELTAGCVSVVVDLKYSQVHYPQGLSAFATYPYVIRSVIQDHLLPRRASRL